MYAGTAGRATPSRRTPGHPERRLAALGLAAIVTALALACGSARTQATAAEAAPPAAPAPRASAATAPLRVVEAPGTTSLFVTHEVTDRAGFEEYLARGDELRQRLGVRAYTVATLVERPERVVIHLVFDTEAHARASVSDPDVQRYLSTPGAPLSSLAWVAGDLRYGLPEPGPEVDGGHAVFVRFRAADADAARRWHDLWIARLGDAGELRAYGIHQSLSDGTQYGLHYLVRGATAEALLAVGQELSATPPAAAAGASSPTVEVADARLWRRLTP